MRLSWQCCWWLKFCGILCCADVLLCSLLTIFKVHAGSDVLWLADVWHTWKHHVIVHWNCVGKVKTGCISSGKLWCHNSLLIILFPKMPPPPLPPQKKYIEVFTLLCRKKCRFFLVRYLENRVRMCITHCCEFMISEKKMGLVFDLCS